ncbi:MAG: xanthine dehydrogenase small subunit [Rhodospirillales bacterium]|nr:xanthine dehydrogenase small subunit [Rhodospirillales bacterium]MBT4041773.1 xanthine dehydrogenase small subunit [Rhodospirillales bacterium]MBT5351752.1 xanthine dehydrogenase small subunit [Rhodospirillales bacterium]MBT5521545.1 xanthine dehydrogenase small subunit [Rhodospirillales bacterium]MBT6108886.1 xanthine dehydrogenase small subunit [Rhodospirillales bacterium]
MRDHGTFLLNGERHEIRDMSPTTTLLNYLREDQKLTGTKEGCAEGDCGACTVVVSELVDGAVQHRAVNACIQFLPMLEGKSVTTVERLRGPGGTLHPCQQALVDTHGSQCGFCTPGFAMSLFAAYEDRQGKGLDRDTANDVLAGNLCRCTGYGPIITAAETMGDLPAPQWGEDRAARELRALEALCHTDTVKVASTDQQFFAPATLGEFAELFAEFPDATIVAGATDVGLWVTKRHMHLKTIIYTGRVQGFAHIAVSDNTLTIGAGATYSDAIQTLAEHFPDLGELVRRIGSTQVRNAGTIGGNIANGSPIGDCPPALIALNATLVLRTGDAQRRIPLEDFFVDYGVQDRKPGEFVEAIEVPLLENPDQFRCYKLTKRFDQDISAVCGCFHVTVDDGQVSSARIAYGGMAATPKRASAVEAALVGKAWTMETCEAALSKFSEDFSPMTDMRASSDYRMRSAQNLLIKYFVEGTEPLSTTRLVGRGSTIAGGANHA